MSNKIAKRTYPWTTELGGKPVTFRLMERKDKEIALSLSRKLPDEDLLFLTFDLTDPQSNEHWFDNIEAGKGYTVLAESNGQVVGMASLTFNQLPWTRHLGEIWIVAANDWRGRGLGKVLVNEIFVLAQELGLQKLVAQMASDQFGAIQLFERLGFKPEALLADHVIDQKNRTRDLVIMSYDITSFNE